MRRAFDKTLQLAAGTSDTGRQEDLGGWGMLRWISRFLSIDDFWSALGYVLLLAVNRLGTRPLELSGVSLLASGMLATVWLLSGNIRARNLERNPNARVVFWALVAAVSILGVIK